MRTWQPSIGVVGAVALAATAAVVWPSRAHAQVQVVPALGYYLPVGGWTQQQDDVLRRQLSALVLGTRLVVWMSKRFALEGTLAITPSQVAVSTANGTTDFNGGVYFASARGALKVGTLTDASTYDVVRWDLMLSAGLGFVHRGGTAWQNTIGVTAPVLVLASELGVGEFRITLEDYVSWAQFDGGRPSQTRPRVHHDMVFSVGYVLRLAGL